jgi:hypothetical protein
VSHVELIDFVQNYRRENPNASKQQIAAATATGLGLTKHRSIFACGDYAVRFSEANGPSFSNVVLSLSALRSFDDVPFIVAVLRPGATDFLLANTTFLRKISHSSHQLRIDNIRGSFLGHDIIRDYEGIPNEPANFDTLFSIHQEFGWQENLERLVEATNAISGRGARFVVTDNSRAAILRAPELAAAIVPNPVYQQLKRELATIVHERSAAILAAGAVDNVNLRGNQIEQLITGGINEHRLADMIRHVDGVELQLEIKTKLMDRASSPKAYNVDKALATLGTGRSLIAFCFVGVNVGSGQVTTSTVSIFDRAVLAATRIQFHWAGRNSRGVTQLTGNLAPLFSPTYAEQINVVEAQQFLERLLNL